MNSKGHIFGNSKLKTIKKGDLVRWHTLIKVNPPIMPGRARDRRSVTEPAYKENIGIVTNVVVEYRGGRNVALAKVIPLNEPYSVGTEIEVFLACLKVISKSAVT